jgi:hypothetical protein
MEQLEIFFEDNEILKQYEAIPAPLQRKLETHFATLVACVSMRKTPFPAHRNRGVSITVENPRTTVVVHATRVQGGVEILGVIARVRTPDQQEDYRAERGVDCPFCGAGKGNACVGTDGHVLTYVGTRKDKRRTHAARRELHQTGSVKRFSGVQKSIPFMTASGIRNEMADGRDSDWAEVFDQYRNMYDSVEMADGLVDGAMRVIEKHHPDHLWSPSKFWNLMCEHISGPHENPDRMIVTMMGRSLRLGIITQKQHDYYLRMGVRGYAAFVGLDFAPHPLGGFVAVRSLKGI